MHTHLVCEQSIHVQLARVDDINGGTHATQVGVGVVNCIQEHSHGEKKGTTSTYKYTACVLGSLARTTKDALLAAGSGGALGGLEGGVQAISADIGQSHLQLDVAISAGADLVN